MFVEERHQQILAELNLNGKILVKDLSERFQVTPDLIRKDLAFLEKGAHLKRVYGGAVLPQMRMGQTKATAKEITNENRDVKRRIAAKAESMIQNGDMVFLDISTTNIEVANLLVQKNRNVTVVTNMIDIIQVLTAESRVKLIFIGGKLNRSKDGFTGAVSIEWLSRYQFDLAFIGVVGIDLARNSVNTYEIDDALTKTSVMKVSRKSYIVAGSSKFNQQGNCRSAALDDFQGIITDKDANPENLEKLASLGLDVCIV